MTYDNTFPPTQRCPFTYDAMKHWPRDYDTSLQCELHLHHGPRHEATTPNGLIVWRDTDSWQDISPEATSRWARTERKAKLICPICGHTGYDVSRSVSLPSSWLWAHRFHTTAPCGKRVTRVGYKAHINRCRHSACVGGVSGEPTPLHETQVPDELEPT